MANLFQFVDWVTMESLRILINKSQVAQFMNTDYNKEFTREFAVGEVVRVKLPQRFLIRDGLGYTPQPITRKYTTVACDQIFGIDFEWDSVEKALKAERGDDAIRREYIEPAMSQLANELDSRAALWAYRNTNNIVGALGTLPTFPDTFLSARQRLNQLSCPAGERGMIITPAIEQNSVKTAVQYFNPTSEISRQYKEGSMGRNSGFDWYSSNNLYSHTAGIWQTPSSVTVKGSGQSGSTLLINATAGDTFNVGDVFSIASVYEVNPVSRRVVNATQKKEFVITVALTAAGGGVDILNISPPIAGPGDQYQNVDALPTDTSVLTLFPGTTTPSTGPKSGIQALALHRDAFAMVGVKLETPKAVELASQQRDPTTGLAIRFVRAWNNQTSQMQNRFDILIGFGNLYPDNCAVRVLSA